jgi:hypothetical protein
MQHLHIIEERSPRVATRFSRVSFLDAPVFFHVAPKRLGPRHPNALQFIHVPSQDPQVAYLVAVCGVLLDLLLDSCFYSRRAPGLGRSHAQRGDR